MQEFLALLLGAAGKLPNGYTIGGKAVANDVGMLDLSGWSLVYLDRRSWVNGMTGLNE